ncbi:AbrB/MazE/SpoVT family DNA-binding domain-containing protein [Sphingomonas ursincola]|jgi:antitoxin MazE|uniref:AbrB/MazE/SpoVT family DNA-binding domain-containing protein n=1 Tax=Sphingomonas ursincola TaxID=56361 RepID=UPI002354534F|nr:AbrB/MazE/SpoVT family DNA-binding domain-containing protein [Sphingomonas ursincola]MBY0620682.1 hypothetical protein [Sphingomonas ursincola]
MKSALRKMGNSTGLILPKPVLQELGVETGTVMDIVVDNGRVVATPVVRDLHEGWAEAARQIGAEDLSEDAMVWQGFPNEDDDGLTW